LSFFDDDEDEGPGPSPPQQRTRIRSGASPRPTAQAGARSGARSGARASGGARGGSGARSGGSATHLGGPHAPDHHTLMVRRRIAAGVAVVFVIVLALLIDGCLKNGKEQSLKTYNHNVGELMRQSDEEVSHPLFTALAGAGSKTPLQVEQELDGYRETAEKLAADARKLSVPGEMTGAQRSLLLALGLRSEGVGKITALVHTALGGQNKQAFTKIAGDMENFLASDVVYSQRVAPLITQELAAAGISDEQTPASSNFLPNLGWLEASTVQARMTGQSSSSSSGPLAPGTHGSALLGTSIGATTLQPAPAENHVSAGANPTFTVNVEDSGSNSETNVKVEVTVTNSGTSHKGVHVVPKTEPGKTYPVNVTVQGVAQGVASRVTAYVVPVPGETNIENNKQAYNVLFE
jgi:hypothetical protein